MKQALSAVMAACVGTLPRMVITSVSGPDWATIMTAFRDGGRRDRGCWDRHLVS